MVYIYIWDVYLLLVRKFLCKNICIFWICLQQIAEDRWYWYLSMLFGVYAGIICLFWPWRPDVNEDYYQTTCALRRTRCQALNWKEVPGRTHPQDEHFLQVKFGKSTKAFIQAQRRAVVWLILHDFGRFSTQKGNSKRRIRGSEVSTEQWACLKFEK